MAEQVPVLIVGAGPVGLNLELQLRHLGVSFRIIDIARDINQALAPAAFWSAPWRYPIP